MKFQVGDRVRGYFPPGRMGSVVTGQVCRVTDDSIYIGNDNFLEPVQAHPKQCRRLVKKERRRVWIDRKHFEVKSQSDKWPKSAWWEPSPQEDYIEFREVKKK